MIGETSYVGSGSMLKPTHYVNPHWVNSYVKRDGTFVRGFWRDGDGDTSINRTIGYFAGNPIKHIRSSNGLTFTTGTTSFADTLSTLFWGSFGVGMLALGAKNTYEGLKETYQNFREEQKAKGGR